MTFLKDYHIARSPPRDEMKKKKKRLKPTPSILTEMVKTEVEKIIYLIFLPNVNQNKLTTIRALTSQSCNLVKLQKFKIMS